MKSIISKKKSVRSKKIASVLLSFAILASSFALPSKNVEAAITYRAGDILVTRSTSSYGLTGHAGLVLSENVILHIQTYGYTPARITKSTWLNNYPQTKVIRPNSESLGREAVKKALDAFDGKNIDYGLSGPPTNIEETYCSEIVWYSYYKAGKTYKVLIEGSQHTPSYWAVPYKIKPYDYTSEINQNYNGFYPIDNSW